DDVVQGLTAVLELAGQEVHEVVIGVDEPGADAVPLGGVCRLFVSAMERPQLLARKTRGTSHYLLVKPLRGAQPARCLTIRKLTCPVRGSMTGRKSSTKQRIISYASRCSSGSICVTCACAGTGSAAPVGIRSTSTTSALLV